MSDYFFAIDVGSFSVRCGLFLLNKKLILVDKVEIKIRVYNEEENYYEQSSNNIWDSICIASKKLISKSNVDINLVKGIGFDATCSLVALDKNLKPLSVSKSGDNERNIIMWMDHRAVVETRFINQTCHKALQTVGGNISIEMQTPKLLWLKKNLPHFINRVSSLFDLPDYLTYRATGSRIRSLCSVTCKWGFNAEENCWDRSYFEAANLGELCDDDFDRIGKTFCLPGTPINGGLSEEAANDLGLKPGIIVPGSLIDAYAGMLGALSKTGQLVTIAGTSACHMVLCPTAIFIDGIWGPYKNVLVADQYVLEAGQSTVGILLDRILQMSTTEVTHIDVLRNLLYDIDVQSYDYDTIMGLSSEKWLSMNNMARDIHINPDFLGNRSPRADLNIRGSMIGLSLDNSPSYISKLYLAAIHGLSYGFKEIITELKKKNVLVESIKICGGLSKNALYVRVLADVSGLPVFISLEEDLVLKGTAILNIIDQIKIFDDRESDTDTVINPDKSLKKLHEEKFDIYLKIINFQLQLTRK